jgi:DNA-3-methyladenine glycosylase II
MDLSKQSTRGRTNNPATQHTFEVRWSGPLNISSSLEIFRRWGDDLIDRWDGCILMRTTRVQRQTVPFACTIIGTIEEPAAEVTVADPDHASPVEHVVKGMFITAPEALADLAAIDPVIARLEERYRGVRPVLQSDLMTALIRSISAQQVNLTWAATTRRRLAEAFGHQHTLGTHRVVSLESARLAAASVDALRALQFTTRKAEYITALALAVQEGTCDLMALREQSDAEVIRHLTHIRGIGRWTAEWFLARALGRPCVVAGDLGVRKAVGAGYLQGRLASEAEVRELTAHWGEAAGVAQQLMLHALSYGWE